MDEEIKIDAENVIEDVGKTMLKIDSIREKLIEGPFNITKLARRIGVEPVSVYNLINRRRRVDLDVAELISDFLIQHNF